MTTQLLIFAASVPVMAAAVAWLALVPRPRRVPVRVKARVEVRRRDR